MTTRFTWLPDADTRPREDDFMTQYIRKTQRAQEDAWRDALRRRDNTMELGNHRQYHNMQDSSIPTISLDVTELSPDIRNRLRAMQQDPITVGSDIRMLGLTPDNNQKAYEIEALRDKLRRSYLKSWGDMHEESSPSSTKVASKDPTYLTGGDKVMIKTEAICPDCGANFWVDFVNQGRSLNGKKMQVQVKILEVITTAAAKYTVVVFVPMFSLVKSPQIVFIHHDYDKEAYEGLKSIVGKDTQGLQTIATGEPPADPKLVEIKTWNAEFVFSEQENYRYSLLEKVQEISDTDTTTIGKIA